MSVLGDRYSGVRDLMAALISTSGGEKLYVDAPDAKAVQFYKNYEALASASEAERPSLAGAFESLLEGVTGANILYKTRATEVSILLVLNDVLLYDAFTALV